MKRRPHVRFVSHPLPVLAVAVAMTFLAAMAIRAWVRSHNRFLLYVAGAFAVFALKSVITAYGLQTGTPGHENLELVGTVLDAVIAGLLVVPFILRPR